MRRLLFSTLVAVTLTIVVEGGALADQSCVFRAATAEEQKFYADAHARFQKIAPLAPAGWTATDTIPGGASGGVAKEVCAAPGQRVFHASFGRSYNLAAQEVFAREAELGRKLAALMAENNAAMKAGKPVNWEAFEAAKKKLGGEAERDTAAEPRVLVGHDAPNVEGFSPAQVPAGKGYRQVFTTEHGVPHQDLIIVLNPGTPTKSALTFVMIGDPTRVEALLKAAVLQ
jgi:hypothetical protein